MKSFAIHVASTLALGTIVAFSLILPFIAAAQYEATYRPMVLIPGVTDITAQEGGAVLSQYVNALYGLAIVIAGMIAVIKLVLAGAKYMMSDSFTSKGQAIEDIKGALLGILIILTAFLILATINPRLTGIDFLPDSPAVANPGDGLGFLLDWNPSCVGEGTCREVQCETLLDGDCVNWCNALNGAYNDRTAGLGVIVGGAGTDSCYINDNLIPPPGAPVGGQPNTFYCPDAVYGADFFYSNYRCTSWCEFQGGTPGETAAPGDFVNDRTCTFPEGGGGPATQTIQIPCEPGFPSDGTSVPVPNCGAAQGQCSSQNGVATVYADYVSCTTVVN